MPNLMNLIGSESEDFRAAIPCVFSWTGDAPVRHARALRPNDRPGTASRCAAQQNGMTIDPHRSTRVSICTYAPSFLSVGPIRELECTCLTHDPSEPYTPFQHSESGPDLGPKELYSRRME